MQTDHPRFSGKPVAALMPHLNTSFGVRLSRIFDSLKQIVFSRKQFSATKINLLHRYKVTIFSTLLQPRVSGNKMAAKFFLGFAQYFDMKRQEKIYEHL